MMLGQEAYSRI